jgi:hypothetical protein
VKGDDRYTEYYAILDYGGVRDRCALGIMHGIPGSDTAVIDRLDCWQGTHAKRIDINIDPTNADGRSVQGWIEIVRKNFNIVGLVLDPAQLEGLAIYYERLGIRVHRFDYRGGKANHRMAQILKTSIQNRKVTWSKDAGRLPKHIGIDGRVKVIEDDTFAKELSMLVIKPMVYGYRFDHESGRHDDRAVVVGMGLLHLFPNGVPEGSQGPMVIEAPHKPLAPGVVPSRRLTSEEFDPVAAYRIFGTSPQGSAWERGDLGDRP